MKIYLLSLVVLFSLGCGSTEHETVKSEPLTGAVQAGQLLKEHPNFNEIYGTIISITIVGEIIIGSKNTSPRPAPSNAQPSSSLLIFT